MTAPAFSPTECLGRGLALLFALAIIVVIAFFVLDEANARFGVLALSVVIVTLTQPLAHGRWGRAGWLIDGALIAAFAYAGFWFFAVKQQLFTGFYMPNPSNVAAGIAGMVALILLTARAWGLSLVIMALVFIAFGFAGPSLPGLLEHFGMEIGDFMQIAWYSFDGVFGRTTGLVADNVLIFLIFGAVLERTGAGESLIHISTALTARIRGGAAHAAIVASAVFGMMSGSVAANIAGTGVFTIPMIKRQGFSANFAGAVETAASSGGQLTPPIMAAAVFVMADLVGMPFALVIVAAALPALFKYIGLFAQVYAEAVRLDIKTLPRDQIPQLTARDWLNSALVFLPIAALMATFISGKSPAMAGLVGVLTAIVTGLILNPDFRRDPGRILTALTEGGISAAQIMLAVGVIGIVLAVVNETGVAIRFATSIASVGDSNLILALVLAMCGALILGMGLPTLPAYLIIAIMIAPAIIKAGVLPLAAHMFVLYFAVYSSIVPPIAYGCYVAAPIAGGNPLQTAFVALRISIVGLLVPYVFVFSPSLLLVAGEFSWSELIYTILRLLAAVWMFATSLGGADPRLARLGLGQRSLRFAIGAAAMIPVLSFWAPACLAALAIGLFSPKPKQQTI
ncbi:TRAP transporter permease [Lutimaribacter saemankumensis]|uniref:TRAP transporter, 4TM/12TM fusion protein n=1 Tax=Lutimaribacter saemankumensis TaxID=490829 RepID=A0A1G8JMB8_9RHOB|nr:TRAP transporter fused permease subunit [Lutimaribacter saemankumensis]SDI32439.1 TRAP transporter, 4TM/12TM fusion protein [Lutimaribacter saemankumensis]